MKRGFTLIELLAVIVILAIVALIATPIILGIINDAKIRSAEQSVNGIIDSLKQKYASLQLKNNVPLPVYVSFGDISLQYETEIENLTDISNEIEVDGNLPTNGMIILKKDGKVEFGYSDITMNGYVCTIDNDKVNCGIQSNSKYTKESCFEFSGISITGYKDHCPKNVVIPPTITIEGKTYEVRNIGSRAFEEKELLSVDFSNAVHLNKIDYSAFRDNEIEHVDLSKNKKLYQIGNYAFANNKIVNYKLYEEEQVLGEYNYGFFNNNKLPDDEAFVYRRNSDGTIDKTTIVSYGGANKNPKIPSNVKTIGSSAFQSTNLESINFSEAINLEYIGSSAFEYNKIGELNLNGLTNLNKIGSYAFHRSGLTKVNLSGSGIKEIGSSAFARGNSTNYVDDNKIKSLNLSGCKSLEIIGSSAFAWNSVDNLDLSGLTNLREIGGSAFEWNNMSSLDLSGLVNLEIIGGYAFYKNGLKHLNLSECTSLTTIGSSAFDRCSFESIDLSNCINLTTIGSSAFRKKLESGYFSNTSLTNIKSNGKEFDWNSIINGTSGTVFVTGVVENSLGNVTIE